MMTLLKEKDILGQIVSLKCSHLMYGKDYFFIECVQFSLHTCVIGATPTEEKLKFQEDAIQIKIIAEKAVSQAINSHVLIGKNPM